MFRLDLAERLGMTLGVLDATMGARELMLWYAKAEIDSVINTKLNKHKGLTYSQALDQARADHRAVIMRKRKI
jgi:hypothetical protein